MAHKAVGIKGFYSKEFFMKQGGMASIVGTPPLKVLLLWGFILYPIFFEFELYSNLNEGWGLSREEVHESKVGALLIFYRTSKKKNKLAPLS